jgi:hypothetical protein
VTSFPPDPLAYLRVTAVLVAIWSIIAQLEWAAMIDVFRPGGLLHGAGPRARALRWLRRLMSVEGVVLLTVVRIAGALVLLIAAKPLPLAFGFALTLGSAPVMALGLDLRDGSDKMGLIVTLSGLLGALGLWRGDSVLGFAGVLLAGGQLTLCYAISGAAKLLRADWRDGSVLRRVMQSASYGHPHAAFATRSGLLCVAFCWALMLAETLFPLALLAPAPILWGALAFFLIFHVASAYFMGLNTFAWAFPAAFPAVLLLGQSVHALL